QRCNTLSMKCYTQSVPTTRPRHFVTESDALAAALAAASARWPDLSRAQIVVRLALEGSRAAQHDHDRRHERRLAAPRQGSGALPGAYGPGYREQLPQDWPE